MQFAASGIVKCRVTRRRRIGLQLSRCDDAIAILIRPDEVHREPSARAGRACRFGHRDLWPADSAIAVQIGPLQPPQSRRPGRGAGQRHHMVQPHSVNGYAVAIARDQRRHLFQIGRRIVCHLLGQSLRHRTGQRRGHQGNQKHQSQTAHRILHA